MKKILAMLVICLFLTGGTAFGNPKHYVLDTVNSGATMGVGANSGVSLLGAINNATDNLGTGIYSIQLGALTFADDDSTIGSSGLTNANPSGTGLTVDAGIPIIFRYGVSNTKLTTAQWQAKGLTGTTLIVTQDIGSGSTKEPFEFDPDPARYLALFVYSGTSQFLVPRVYVYGK